MDLKKVVVYIKPWICGLFVAALALHVPAAQAHPHALIVQRLNVVFDEKGLAGINVWWKFDEMFASMVAEDHDLNRNGRFEANEIKAVQEKAFASISQHSYFTFIKLDKTPFNVKYIRDFNATLDNGKLVYEFHIPCHVTATKQVKKVAVASYDPSYFIAIYFTQKIPVSLTAADGFDVKTSLKKDPDTTYYFDLVHPWTLFMEFRQK